MQFLIQLIVNKILPIAGLELWISGVGSNRSTNWATTTTHLNLFDSQNLF